MNNQHAFPANHFDLTESEHGMTLRDYFAAKAMHGMMGSAWTIKPSEIPKRAYEIADLMLEARQK